MFMLLHRGKYFPVINCKISFLPFAASAAARHGPQFYNEKVFFLKKKGRPPV